LDAAVFASRVVETGVDRPALVMALAGLTSLPGPGTPQLHEVPGLVS
jgi:hypothetical protein